ncbi:MAG: dTDP-4-dehydrorhamnose reductase [Planctomycetia bacterium]
MSRRPRVLLLGARGRLGEPLARVLGTWCEVLGAGRRAGDVVAADLAQPASLEAAVAATRPAVVFNAAGYADVDRAEQEAEAAEALNAVAPAVLARAATRAGAVLVHVGTDYVFDGTRGQPYREEDAPHPLSAYGRTKWAGEQAVLADPGPHLVLRTSWAYAQGRPCWLTAMEQRLRSGAPLRAVHDQWGSPTWAPAFADACSALLQRLRGVGPAGDIAPPAVRGAYHLAGEGGASWHDLAVELCRLLGVPSAVDAVSRSAWPQPARRPRDSRLDTGRAARVLGVRLPPWRESLAACVAGASRP